MLITITVIPNASRKQKLLLSIFDIGVTQMRSVDVHKGALKADRHIKELQFTTDENRKNIDRMNELVDKLQGKIRM